MLSTRFGKKRRRIKVPKAKRGKAGGRRPHLQHKVRVAELGLQKFVREVELPVGTDKVLLVRELKKAFRQVVEV